MEDRLLHKGLQKNKKVQRVNEEVRILISLLVKVLLLQKEGNPDIQPPSPSPTFSSNEEKPLPNLRSGVERGGEASCPRREQKWE